MQYQVPQYIEIEDKVVGPLTFRQFVYVAGGIGLSFVLYIWLPLIVAVPLIGLTLGLAGALAFYKINNKPFVHFMESAFKYAIGNRLYIWKKEAKKPEAKKKEEQSSQLLSVPTISESKLHDIAWSLDVHDDVPEQSSVDDKTQDATI